MTGAKLNREIGTHPSKVSSFPRRVLDSLKRAPQKRLAKVVAFEVTVSVLLLVISLRSFVFAPGYFVYADQFWMLRSNLPNSETFVPLLFTSGRVTPSYFFQFTRDFLSWPSIAILALAPSYQAAIRSFVLYTFVLYVGLAWITSETLVRALEVRTRYIVTLRSREFVKFAFVVAAFTNFVAIQYNADGGTLSDGLILLILVLEVVIFFGRVGLRESLTVGGLLGITLLLDPDYFLLSLIALGCIALVSACVQGQFVARMRGYVVALAVSLPVLLFVLEGIVVTSPPVVTTLYRPISDALELSHNLNVYTALSLTGYGWPTATMGPPSILWSGPISTQHAIGSPTNVLAPPGLVTGFWLLATMTLPILAFGTLLRSGIRKFTMPACVMGLLGVVLALYPQNPLLYQAFAGIATLPTMGPFFGTSVAVPDHFLILVAACYLVAAPSMLFNLIGSDTFHVETSSPHPTVKAGGRVSSRLRSWTPQRRRRTQKVVAVAAVALVLFSGWQALDGSYYPARAENSTFVGNGVPNVGAYTPFTLPVGTLQAYNFLFANGTGFNVYWPVGYGVALDGFRTSVPSISVPGFRLLLSQDLPADVSPYLASHGVRYVVVQNQSTWASQFYVPSAVVYQYHSNPYLYYFGLPSYASVVQFFNSTPGLTPAFFARGLTIFQVQGSPDLTYRSSLLLNFPTYTGLVPTTYGLFSTLNVSVALTNTSGAGATASFGESGAPLTVLTPQNLATAYLPNAILGQRNLTSPLETLTPGIRYVANTTTVPGSASWGQNSSQGQFNVDKAGFVFTNWGGNFTAKFANGFISLYSASGSTVSLNFGGPATPAAPGVVVPPGPMAYLTTFGGSLSLSNPSRATVGMTFVAINQSDPDALAFSNYNLKASPSGEAVSVANPLPNRTQSFTYRLGGSFVGYMNISYYNLTVIPQPLHTDSSLPFGAYVSVVNTSLALRRGSQAAYLFASGNGTVNNIPIDGRSFADYRVASGGLLVTSGSVNIAALVITYGTNLTTLSGYYATYNGAFSSSVLVQYGNELIAPISSDYGSNLYILPGPGGFAYVAPSLVYLELAYVLVLGYTVLLGLIGTRLLYRTKQRLTGNHARLSVDFEVERRARPDSIVRSTTPTDSGPQRVRVQAGSK
jgi:hypothetical protein